MMAGAGGGCAAALAASPCLAQEGQEGLVLDPITVTGAWDNYDVDYGFNAEFQTSATKTPLTIRETPQAVSVVTLDSMETRQVRDVRNALEMAAGVSTADTVGGPFAGTSRFNSERFMLRGQRLDNNRDVRTDGFAGASSLGSPDIALFERGEVIKGPSASLYGTSSLGGFINRVTKKPDAERAASVMGNFGSFDTLRGELDVTGAIDAEGRYSARLIGVLEDSGSFIEGAGREVAVIAPMLSARVGDDTRVLVQTYFQNLGGTPSMGIPVFEAPDGQLSAPGRISRTMYPGVIGDSDTNNDEYFLSALVEHEISDRWLASLRLQRSHSEASTRIDAYAYGVSPDGETTLYAASTPGDVDAWSGELRLDGAFTMFGNEHRLVAGVEAREVDDWSGNAYQFVGTGNLFTGDFDADLPVSLDAPLQYQSRLRTKAVYGQLILGLTPGTRLITGLRYENAQQLGRAGVGTPTATRNTTDDTAPSWRVGLSQDLAWRLTGFAAYATTYQPVFVGTVGPDGSVLEPITGDGLEFGLKGDWLDEQLGATLSVYRQDLDNVPLQLTREQCLAGGAGITDCSRSAGTQRYEGVELEVSGNPTPALTLGVAASWQNGEFTDRSDTDYGEESPNIVKRQTNLFAQYSFEGGRLDGLNVGATLVSLGERNTLRVGQYTDGYNRVDLNFSYEGIPGWNFNLLVRNLFDERYLEVVRDTGFQNYFGSPRAALFEARRVF